MANKKALLIVGGCAAVLLLVVGGIILFVFQATSPLTDSADAFFNLVAHHDYTDAYASTSSGFKQNTTESQFESVVKQESLDQYATASWGSRSIDNGTGEIQGTVTLKNGNAIPLTVDLVQENGAWKVYGLSSQGGGITQETSGQNTASDVPPPTDSDAMKLAHDSLVLFAQSIKAKDFTPFYVAESQEWQSQTTPEGLSSSYGTFIDSGLDFSGLASKGVTLAGPASVDTQGELTIDGTVTDVPKLGESFIFEATYIQEAGDWKLFGLNVSVKNN
ncbi:MAG: hypothetical protein WA001_04070 [Patescibacteria group bacterium]